MMYKKLPLLSFTSHQQNQLPHNIIIQSTRLRKKIKWNQYTISIYTIFYPYTQEYDHKSTTDITHAIITFTKYKRHKKE